MTLTGGAYRRESLDGREVKPKKHRGGCWRARGVGHVKLCWPRTVLCEQPGGFKSSTLTEGG